MSKSKKIASTQDEVQAAPNSEKPKSTQKKKTSKNDAQLLIRMNSQERAEFLALCDELDTSAAREIRKFIRRFIRQNQSSDED
ncbi:hypothetical protein [Terasakiispira papahanaumokuakeensis]|uniref:hypothetical protein n=1 Tax=Terasakiispira papahanaumokuakeensis TaxID=197479 RepID=UPI001FE1A0B3|nr:hypothetical protein [Terasakiispira papahanaumokuakeensis]